MASEKWSEVVEAYQRVLDKVESSGLAFEALSKAEKQILAVVLFREEVSNGGLLQWFINPYGDYVSTVLEFLTEHGCEAHLHLIRRIERLCPEGCIPNSQVERQSIAAEWNEDTLKKLDAWTDEYYGLKEDLYDSLAELI